MREIDYEKLLANVKEMINTLEYDSMRSAGKSKLNAPTLVELYELEKCYQTKINSNKQPTKKKEA
jgi:hypothetical protein